MVQGALSNYRKYLHPYRWVVFTVLLFGLMGVLSFFPAAVYTYYSGLFFGLIRSFADLVIRILPFSPFWIFVLVLFLALFGAIRRKKITTLAFWLNSAGVLICNFYILWGLNYKAMDTAELLGLHPESTDLSSVDLSTVVSSMDSMALIELNTLSQKEINKLGQKAVRSKLQALGLNHSGSPSVRYVSGNILRRVGIFGLYLPYSFEAYTDASLRNSPKLFTTAHELCHAYGIGPESEANFIALISLIESESPALRSSARITLVRSLLHRQKEKSQEDFDRAFSTLPNWLARELIAQDKDNEKYRNPLWEMSEWSNDLYLKLNGQDEGTDSYSSYLSLYASYLKEYPSASSTSESQY